MPKVAFYTLGCKLNQYETAVISEIFLNHGFEIVDFNQAADIYVVNSCTVTNRADYKAREFIRKARKINSNAIFIIVGYMFDLTHIFWHISHLIILVNNVMLAIYLRFKR